MSKRILGVLTALTVVGGMELAGPGVSECQAQLIGVPVVAPGRYTVRVRPNGVMRVRGVGLGYAAPVVDPWVSVASAPVATTFVTSAPVVTTTRVVPVAPVVSVPAFSAVPVYSATTYSAPVLYPRVYTSAPAVIGYPW